MNASGQPTHRRDVRSWRPTLDHVWLALAPFAVFVLTMLATVPPNDFWWHMRTGQIILETRAIPTTDLFTYTRAGAPWMNQAWLMQVWLYLLYRAGGTPLVIFAHAATIAVGYGFVVQAGKRACNDARAAALGAMAAVAIGLFYWYVRPQTISFLLFGILVWLLEAHRAGERRAAWALPVLFVLWANLHGAFIFGLLLVGLYVIADIVEWLPARGKSPRRDFMLPAFALASVVAISINPAGPGGLARYLLGFAQSPATQQLNFEFRPMTLRSQFGVVFFGVVITALLIAYTRRFVLPLYHVLAVGTFGVLSLYYIRVAPWFGMVAAPALALLLSGRPRLARQGRTSQNAAILSVMALLMLLTLPWMRPYLPLPPGYRDFVLRSETPEAATDILCKLGGDMRIFNEASFGSYLAWACPAIPIFMDTRFELYDDAMWQDYINVSRARYDWDSILAQRGVDTILAGKVRQGELIDAARISGAWRVVYEDDAAVIFRRR